MARNPSGGRPVEQELPWSLALVDHCLDGVHQRVAAALDLIERPRGVTEGGEPDRIGEGGLQGGFVVESGEAPAICEGALHEGGLAGLSRPGDHDDPERSERLFDDLLEAPRSLRRAATCFGQRRWP